MTEDKRKAFRNVWKSIEEGMKKEEYICRLIKSLEIIKTKNCITDEQIQRLKEALKSIQEAKQKTVKVLDNFRDKDPWNYYKWSKEMVKIKQD